MLTLNADIEAWPTVPVDATWHRLIPSRFPPIQVYERVVANDRYDEVARLEAMTSPRVRARERLTGMGMVEAASPRLQNWNHAPFTYLNPEGSMLFRPGIAALELWDSLQAALAVSVARRERFLSCTNMPRLGLDMRVLKTRVAGQFADLSHLSLPTTKADRWVIGDKLAEANLAGALFRCAERETSLCLGILDAEVLDRSIQADHFRFQWDGERIASLYSFSDGGVEIDPMLLAGPPLKQLG